MINNNKCRHTSWNRNLFQLRLNFKSGFENQIQIWAQCLTGNLDRIYAFMSEEKENFELGFGFMCSSEKRERCGQILRLLMSHHAGPLADTSCYQEHIHKKS